MLLLLVLLFLEQSPFCILDLLVIHKTVLLIYGRLSQVVVVDLLLKTSAEVCNPSLLFFVGSLPILEELFVSEPTDLSPEVIF